MKKGNELKQLFIILLYIEKNKFIFWKKNFENLKKLSQSGYFERARFFFAYFIFHFFKNFYNF
jgi:hypothetical protein